MTTLIGTGGLIVASVNADTARQGVKAQKKSADAAVASSLASARSASAAHDKLSWDISEAKRKIPEERRKRQS
jgi:hypothetical protein